ncbi:translation initiation factor eIF-2B subunit epsilon [Cylas formicarius]|uniref:translation initiation factor eIF-2B subunit epsilon n=1 Tax=Cylas formicarius TaxID=197179 RepID=UPI002958D3DD|nr:translation initiation factor eIF-2B subunit epsilon [Cylas formicarius]
MSKAKRGIVKKESVVQAVIVGDTFEDEFVPISDDVPLCLFPIVNKPLIDYTLEFLSLGGVEETFLFCCNHLAEIRAHINQCIENSMGWTLTMKVQIIASEGCRSFGDCLRDLDAKGLLRGDFILLEPGVISNLNLLPLFKKHRSVCSTDKGAAMTLLFQEVGPGYSSRSPFAETLIAVNHNNRVLYHKKICKGKEKKIEFPLEVFLDNHTVSLHYNLKDTQIAICSPSVLPLFSDNFDFQSKDDFIRGLLLNEEIMGSTIYSHIIKGDGYGGGICNWRMYQSISWELHNRWIYPLTSSLRRNRPLANDVIIGENTNIATLEGLCRTVLGSNVVTGASVKIEDSFVFENTKIEDGVVITHSIVGPDCLIKQNSRITAGSILGKGVVIEENTFIENSLVQANKPEDCEEKDHIGARAYRLRVSECESDLHLDKMLSKEMSKLHIGDYVCESESESDEFTESEDELSYTHSPPPDDTKLFFNEVVDSLTRGYEDKLVCDNLILEINSSRYAYNVTVKEVNFNVIKAILSMSEKLPGGEKYFTQLSQMLSYFAPVLRNYIKNESAMIDCLQAVEDVFNSHENLQEKWVIFVLKYFYEKDYVTEDAILDWFSTVKVASNLHTQVKPFTDWLQQAEEASSSEDE